MAAHQDFQIFQYAADDLASAATGDNTAIFYAPCRIQVVEVGVHITTNLVPGGASVNLIDFDIVSASQGPTGAETVAPARGSAVTTIVTSSSNVTHQDGKVLSRQVDFTLEKGESLVCQVLGGTSGNGVPYIVYTTRGQNSKEAGEQRSGAAAE